MSLRNLARELYRAQQQVEWLEKLLSAAPPAEAMALCHELEEARAEHLQLQKMLNSRKDFSPLSRRF